MPELKTWIQQSGPDQLMLYTSSGETVPFYSAGGWQWIAQRDVLTRNEDGPDPDAPPGSGTGGGGIQVTAQMVQAAVTSVGGSVGAMRWTPTEVAGMFNEAIASTMPGVLTNKKRAACLIGQCAQETDWFKTTTEYSAGGNPYSPYDGRGFIQLTWRDNYAGFGAWMKSKGKLSDANYFVNNPTALAAKEWAAYTALYYFTSPVWNNKNLWKWCDEASSPWATISRAINRGNPSSPYAANHEAQRTTAINAVFAVTPDPPPPPGGGGGTPSVVQAVVDYYVSKVGAWRYSQGPARYTPETSGYSDCSASIRWAYRKIAGIEIGTYTGDQQNYGKIIIDNTRGAPTAAQLALMRPGDCIYIMWNGWNSTYDHVEMYMGSNKNIGHGGPGYGPVITNNTTSYLLVPYRWRVRRFIA